MTFKRKETFIKKHNCDTKKVPRTHFMQTRTKVWLKKIYRTVHDVFLKHVVPSFGVTPVFKDIHNSTFGHVTETFQQQLTFQSIKQIIFTPKLPFSDSMVVPCLEVRAFMCFVTDTFRIFLSIREI